MRESKNAFFSSRLIRFRSRLLLIMLPAVVALLCGSGVAHALADLSITKTDGVTTAVPGGSVTYTITASNAGPDAEAAQVEDPLPVAISSATWTCVGAGGGTCTASGSDGISDSAFLPVGGVVTYTMIATISPSATGTLSNTATVTAVMSMDGDPNPANNSATDTDTLTQSADLATVPTMTEWGMILFMLLAGAGSVFYLRKRNSLG